MQKTARLLTPAWLLIGMTGSVPGKLKLSEQRLSFTAIGCGTLWKKELLKLEKEVAQPGIADKMDNGESALVFDIPLSEISVDFPWYYFSGGMKIRTGKNQFRFSFGQPGNTQLPVGLENLPGAALRIGENVLEIQTMRGRGNAWKAILLEKASN